MWRRAFAVWLLIIGAETVHGVFRTLCLAPMVGDFRARQLGVLTGSLLILAIACLCVDWMHARTTGLLAAIGVVWVVLTLAFEIGLGRLILGYPWERLLADYDVARGGLLPFGLLVMALAPMLAANWRERQSGSIPVSGEGPPAPQVRSGPAGVPAASNASSSDAPASA